MSILHWAIKGIIQEVTATGVEIKVFTFQPCHLWMRWTTTFPQVHSVPVVRRGLAMYTDKRFCFVAYKDNEQSEGDDTYVHTFLKEPWPVCETRYFYFHGKMSGERSRSTSAIFEYHRVTPPPPVETSDQAKDFYIAVGYCQYWNAQAQTFTPDHDYTAKRISVGLTQFFPDYRGPFIVKLTKPDGNCWAETLLWSKSAQSSNLPLSGQKVFTHFEPVNVALLTGVPYRVVVHTTPGWEKWDGSRWVSWESGATMLWWRSDTDSPYPRGLACYGCNFKNSAGGWYTIPTQDHTFIVWE